MKRAVAFFCVVLLVFLSVSGCTTTAKPKADAVTLVVAGPWDDIKALDQLSAAFNKQYPECTIVYENVKDYYSSLEKRMTTNEDPIDLFFTVNIRSSDSPMKPFALDLSAQGDQLDLSQTFDGLIENFTYYEPGSEDNGKLYAIPVGAELRGIYVNKTLLKSVGLDVPTDLTSLLAACEVLKQNGYVPLHGNPGMFGQQFLFPCIANLIANADDSAAAHKLVNDGTDVDGIQALVQEPLQLMYSLMSNDDYRYKYVENELGLFTDVSYEGYSRSFLNIKQDADGNYQKIDDVGQVPFMATTMILGNTLQKLKEDYHSEIDYEFILAPVSDKGGYAYLSPAQGIAINRNSAHLDWALKYLNFFFEPENSTEFAASYNVIPNTKEALSAITSQFDVPSSQICHLGQMTFDYAFYDVIDATLVEIAKGNNPKYMNTLADGSTELYPFEHYLDNFRTRLVEVRAQEATTAK